MFDEHYMKKIREKLKIGETSIVHCRGGVGRAGLFACCLLV